MASTWMTTGRPFQSGLSFTNCPPSTNARYVFSFSCREQEVITLVEFFPVEMVGDDKNGVTFLVSEKDVDLVGVVDGHVTTSVVSICSKYRRESPQLQPPTQIV